MAFDPADVPLLMALTPHAVAGYLRGQGWQDDGPWGKFGRAYIRQVAGESMHITVPTTASINDFAELMAQLVSTVADVEKKSISRVLTELSMAPYDVVRVKAKRSDAFGSVPLTDGEDIFECARDMLVSAAVHTVTNRVEVSRRGPLPIVAKDYIDKVRLGQTERGSFVLTMLSPFSYEVENVEPDMFSEPFGRRVVRHLSTALQGVETALQKSVSEGPDAFRSVTELGVSAKLCRAIGQLAEIGRGTEVSVAWSPQQPVDSQVLLAVQRDSAPILQQAAALLAAVTPPEPITIQGPVLGVSEQSPADFNGEVKIYATVDGTTRVIRATFTGFERQTIFEAFQNKKSLEIAVTGELNRSGRPWSLMNPRDFRVIEMRDSP